MNYVSKKLSLLSSRLPMEEEEVCGSKPTMGSTLVYSSCWWLPVFFQIWKCKKEFHTLVSWVTAINTNPQTTWESFRNFNIVIAEEISSPPPDKNLPHPTTHPTPQKYNNNIPIWFFSFYGKKNYSSCYYDIWMGIFLTT